MFTNLVIKEFQDSEKFLFSTENFLSSNETFYNLKLGIAISIRDKKIEISDPIYVGIYENEKILGCALRSNTDRPIAISNMPNYAIELLINFLLEKNITLNGVVGAVEPTIYFQTQWCQYKKINSKLIMHLGVYETQEIQPPINNYSLILGTNDNQEIILKFVKNFMSDCFTEKQYTDEEILKITERHINNKSIYLLKNNNDDIVSMAASTRGSKNSGTVSLVYTPNELRGNGYASIVTALVSQKILNEKKYVCLFTDLTNPTSNSIYQKIGYQKIGENIHFDFE